MPVVKRRKNAQEEEDETFEHQVSGSDDEESDQEEEVQEEEDSEVQYETDGPSNDEEELPSTSKSLREQVMELKKKVPSKRKNVPEKRAPPVTPVKKLRVVTKEKPSVEVKSKKPVKNPVQKGGKERIVVEELKKTPGAIEYNDKNVDFNLYNEAPEHIKNVKIKISSNVVMLCRMIEATGNTSQGLTYDYAAISFVRQSKNGKAYEFNLPLNLAPSIQKGISLLIKSNPKFFESKVTLVQRDDDTE